MFGIRGGTVVLVLTLMLTSLARADYGCVCNYNVETAVYPGTSSSTQPLGYMYEFDCKPEASQMSTDQWLAVEFEHRYGYVEKIPNIEVQTCPGEPAGADKVHATTHVKSTTTTPATTTTPTPTTPAPTTTTTTVPTQTTTTTPRPTTTSTTTSTTTTTTTTPTTTTATTTPQPTATTATTTTLATRTSALTTSTTSTTTTSKPITQVVVTTARPSTITTAFETSSAQGRYVCPQQYFQHAAGDHGSLFLIDSVCYEVVPVTQTWTAAESDCRTRGGHLAHIPDDRHQNIIYSVVKQYHGDDVWIGLHDRTHEEHFEWTSGDNVTYTNWEPGRKDFLFHSLEDCVSLSLGSYQGRWEDESCSHTYGYVCEFSAIWSTQPITTPGEIHLTSASAVLSGNGNVNLCPARAISLSRQFGTVLVQHEQSCYELLHNRVIWSHAESQCQQGGGHLVHINSASEQQYIEAFMSRYSPDHAIWIGLHDRISEGQFEWTSGDPLTFTNWAPGHTDNFVSHNQEDCVALIPYKGGVWDDIPCGSRDPFFGVDSGETHLAFCEYIITNGLEFRPKELHHDGVIPEDLITNVGTPSHWLFTQNTTALCKADN